MHERAVNEVLGLVDLTIGVEVEKVHLVLAISKFIREVRAFNRSINLVWFKLGVELDAGLHVFFKCDNFVNVQIGKENLKDIEELMGRVVDVVDNLITWWVDISELSIEQICFGLVCEELCQIDVSTLALCHSVVDILGVIEDVILVEHTVLVAQDRSFISLTCSVVHVVPAIHKLLEP